MESGTKKSLATNALVALVGGLLALTLGLQFAWGLWGLALAILPASTTGWILADWRGFATALGRARRKVAETVPEWWEKSSKRIKRFLVVVKRCHWETGILHLVVLMVFWFVVLALTPKAEVNGSLGDEFTCLGVVFGFMGSLMLFFLAKPIVFRRQLQRVLKTGDPHSPFADPEYPEWRFESYWCKLEQKRPAFWNIAARRTRRQSRWFLLYLNPLVAPFTLLYFTIKYTPWAVAGFFKVVGLLIVAFARLVRLTYLYANTDRRRIAFASIALGMSIGCIIGLWLEAVLLGSLLCGAATWLIGWLQHELVYQPLLARGAIRA